MSNVHASQNFKSPVYLLICPLRSKATKAQSEASRFLRTFRVKEAYHFAISVRDEVFELTHREKDGAKEYFINRSPLKEWKTDKDARGNDLMPGWEDREGLGYTSLSNDDIYHIAANVIWARWEKKYYLFRHDCQHFAKLLYKAICERPIPGLFETITKAFGRLWRGNAEDLWRKKFPFRWNRLFTEYPFWVCCVVGGCIIIGAVVATVASHGVVIAPAVVYAVHVLYSIAGFSLAIQLAFRGTRWVSERSLRKKLEREVKAILEKQKVQCEWDDDACSTDRLVLV